MIVDASALLAILREEPPAEQCLQMLLNSPLNRLSAATFLEAAIVADRLPDSSDAAMFDKLLDELAVVIEPVTLRQATVAREAYRRFGRGSGHPAKLNFGDCFAYALAIAYNEPLLFIGNDFVHTDVRRVLG